MTGEVDRTKPAARALKRSVAPGETSAGPPDPETLQRLERALASLPRATREVFLAHRLDGCSYVEIAEATGMNVAAVERRLAAALLAIARELDGEKQPADGCWWRRVRRWFG